MGAISGKYDGTGCPTVIWGKVAGEPKSSTTSGGKAKVNFSVIVRNTKESEDKNKNFVNVTCYGDSFFTHVANSLEKGDIVAVFGEYTERKYTGKDGTEKQWSEVAVAPANFGIVLASDWLKGIANIMASGSLPPDFPEKQFSPSKGVPIQYTEDDDSESELPF